MGKKILIAEDSRTFRQQISIVLESRGYEIVIAEDGAEALDVLTANKDVAVMIVDVNMPRMNGLDFIEKAKKDLNYKGAVAVLTTEGDFEVINRGRALGVNCWMVKPFEPKNLASAIEKLFTIKTAQ